MMATSAPLTRPKVEPLPHHYELSVTAVAEDAEAHISAPPRPDILAGPPPQFGGSEEWWSPEHLLLGAVSLCLQTTFRALARARGVTPSRYTSRVRGILDRTSEGPAFTSIVLDVELRVPELQTHAATELLQRAKQLCIVSHALKPPVDVRVTVQAG